MIQSIKLQTSSILQVSLDKYDKDFTFIINDQEYQTNKLIAELLSPKIAQDRLTDPTMNYIKINTRSKGDFGRFLQLQRFNSETYSETEIDFITEIIEILGTEHLEFITSNDEIDNENVLTRLLEYEKHSKIYFKIQSNAVNYASEHFSELVSKQKEQLTKLSPLTLESIINNENLRLNNEDELLLFINQLYLKSKEYSILYAYVDFHNVETKSVGEFLTIFDFNDIDSNSWKTISARLKEEIVHTNINETKRYKTKLFFEKKPSIEIQYSNKEFEGIINYFRKKSSLDNEVKITSSSSSQYDIQKVLQIEFEKTNYFATVNEANPWICIEFKNHQIIPTYYTIRANNWEITKHNSSNWNPRNWVIECSINSKDWEIIDEQKENADLIKEKCAVQTFQIQKRIKQPFKYFRIRQTGQNWADSNHFGINTLEIYGDIY